MKRGKKSSTGGPAPSKGQQLARQRLSTHDPRKHKNKGGLKSRELKAFRKLKGAGLPKPEEVQQVAMDLDPPADELPGSAQQSAPEAAPLPEASTAVAEPVPAGDAEAPVSQPQKQQQQPGKGKKAKRKPKRKSQLERVAMDVQESKAAEEAKQAQSRQLVAEHKQKLAQRLQERSKKTKLMRKRTKTGQPVMKHRLDSLLSQIEGQS